MIFCCNGMLFEMDVLWCVVVFFFFYVYDVVDIGLFVFVEVQFCCVVDEVVGIVEFGFGCLGFEVVVVVVVD